MGIKIKHRINLYIISILAIQNQNKQTECHS